MRHLSVHRPTSRILKLAKVWVRSSTNDLYMLCANGYTERLKECLSCLRADTNEDSMMHDRCMSDIHAIEQVSEDDSDDVRICFSILLCLQEYLRMSLRTKVAEALVKLKIYGPSQLAEHISDVAQIVSRKEALINGQFRHPNLAQDRESIVKRTSATRSKQIQYANPRLFSGSLVACLMTPMMS